MTKPSSLESTQYGGTHYKVLGIEPAEYCFRNSIPFLEGNAIKYITRHASKGGAEDLMKAIHYCCMVLDMQYGEKVDVQRQDAG